MKPFGLFVFGTVIFVNAAFSQSFGSEGKLQNTVKLPAAILAQLEKTDEVNECFRNSEKQPRFGGSWFQAVKVDLNRDGRPDYVVRSNKDCLLGPRAANWWIYSARGRGFKLVLHDSILLVEIRRTKTRGYHDIRTETVFLNIIRNTWKFNGREYEIMKTRIIEPER